MEPGRNGDMRDDPQKYCNVKPFWTLVNARFQNERKSGISDFSS